MPNTTEKYFGPNTFQTVLWTCIKLTSKTQWTNIISKLWPRFYLLLTNKLFRLIPVFKSSNTFWIISVSKHILVHEKQKKFNRRSQKRDWLRPYLIRHIGTLLLGSAIAEQTCSVNTNMCTASTVNRHRCLCVCVVFQCSTARRMEPITWQACVFLPLHFISNKIKGRCQVWCTTQRTYKTTYKLLFRKAGTKIVFWIKISVWGLYITEL